MKKILIFLSLFLIPNITFSFDFSDTKAKKDFCENYDNFRNLKYDEKNDFCVETYYVTSSSEFGEKNEKNIINHDFKNFYCQKGGDYTAFWSYVKETCVFSDDTKIYMIFL